MIVRNSVSAVFHCSPERAFKTPILGDATQMLTGYGVIPACIGFTDDETWGKPGGHRIPLIAGSLLVRKGPQAFDQILARNENKYWKWQIDNFNFQLFFAKMAQGEWICHDKGNGAITVQWIYTFFSRNIIVHPITWVFVKIFWLGMQRQAIKKMRVIAESDTPFIYK